MRTIILGLVLTAPLRQQPVSHKLAEFSIKKRRFNLSIGTAITAAHAARSIGHGDDMSAGKPAVRGIIARRSAITATIPIHDIRSPS